MQPWAWSPSWVGCGPALSRSMPVLQHLEAPPRPPGHSTAEGHLRAGLGRSQQAAPATPRIVTAMATGKACSSAEITHPSPCRGAVTRAIYKGSFQKVSPLPPSESWLPASRCQALPLTSSALQLAAARGPWQVSRIRRDRPRVSPRLP